MSKAVAILERRSTVSSSASGPGNSITTLKKMRFCYIREQTMNKFGQKIGADTNEVDPLFSRPVVLFRLGQFLIELQKHIKRIKDLPLILLSEKPNEGLWVIVGISPAGILQRIEGNGVNSNNNLALKDADDVDQLPLLNDEEEEEGNSITKRRKLDTQTDTPVEDLHTGVSNFKRYFQLVKQRLSLGTTPNARYRDDCK